MKGKKRKVTLIPYGFIAMMSLYLLDVYIFKFQDGSKGFGTISVLVFISMVVMFIHIIRIIKQLFRNNREKNGPFYYQIWKSDYATKNPGHNKTEDELRGIFYEERKAIEFEKNKAEIERNQALREKRLAEAKRKKEEQMERVGYASKPAPYEQTNYQPVQDNNVARCPKCGSTSLTANKKGFSLAKGALGVATLGAYGVVAAGHGKNKVIVTCLKCGHQWKAGKK